MNRTEFFLDFEYPTHYACGCFFEWVTGEINSTWVAHYCTTHVDSNRHYPLPSIPVVRGNTMNPPKLIAITSTYDPHDQVYMLHALDTTGDVWYLDREVSPFTWRKLATQIDTGA